jgi:hypothetical protein
MNPLVKQMQGKLKGQNHFRSLLIDDRLRVLGGKNSVWAIGDASTIASVKALDYADELFEQADVDGNNSLSLSELRVRLPSTPLHRATCTNSGRAHAMQFCRMNDLLVGARFTAHLPATVAASS